MEASDKENAASICDTSTKIHSLRLSIATALSAVNQAPHTDDSIHLENRQFGNLFLVPDDDKLDTQTQGAAKDVDPHRVVDNDGEGTSDSIVRTEAKDLGGILSFPNNGQVPQVQEATAPVEACAGEDLDGQSSDTPHARATDSPSCQKPFPHTQRNDTATVSSSSCTKRDYSTAFGSPEPTNARSKRATPSVSKSLSQPKQSKPSIEWPFIPSSMYFWHALDPTKGIAIDEDIIKETRNAFAAAHPAYELGEHLSYYTLPDDKHRILVHAFGGDEVKTTFKYDRLDPTIGVDMCRLLEAHPHLTIRAVEQGQFHYAYHKRKFHRTKRYVCPHCKGAFPPRDPKGTNHFVECPKLIEMEKIAQEVNEIWFPKYGYREAWSPAVIV